MEVTPESLEAHAEYIDRELGIGQLAAEELRLQSYLLRRNLEESGE